MADEQHDHFGEFPFVTWWSKYYCDGKFVSTPYAELKSRPPVELRQNLAEKVNDFFDSEKVGVAYVAEWRIAFVDIDLEDPLRAPNIAPEPRDKRVDASMQDYLKFVTDTVDAYPTPAQMPMPDNVGINSGISRRDLATVVDVVLNLGTTAVSVPASQLVARILCFNGDEPSSLVEDSKRRKPTRVLYSSDRDTLSHAITRVTELL